MKHFLLFLSLTVGLLNVQAADDENTVSSKIKNVTVFLRGAQINRQANVTLKAGTNTVVFNDLSPLIDPNSVQVKGSDRYTILSVNYRQNFLETASSEKRTDELVADREDLRERKAMRESMRSVYREERSMLMANQKLTGKDESMLIEDLMEMAEFYRNRMKDIEFKLLEIDRDIKEFNRQEGQINQELEQLAYNKGKNTGEVVIQITAKAPAAVQMNVSFLVREAGWIPEYDIRSEDLGGPIELTYKGRVWQNSGNDWDKVNITLNTGNPALNNTQPDVNPWVLQFQQPVYYGTVTSNAMYTMEEEEVLADDYEYGRKDLEELKLVDELSQTLADHTTVSTSGVVTEFQVKVPYTIPSNSQEYTVEVQDHQLPVKYNYFAAPKFDPDAFLLARVTGWDELNLLSGNAHVYFQGTYVGKSYIDTRNTSDTLDVSLGRDKGVVITRSKIKDYSKSSIAGSTRKQQVGIEIGVRNNKGKQVVLTLEDQIPKSSRKEIVVEMDQAVGAEYNEETGKLTWKVVLPPGEAKTYTFRYTVKYPKDKVIPNL